MIAIKASARLSQAHQVLAATAADAGKIVLWVKKATGAEGTAKGKAGKTEQMIFKIKEGKDILSIVITLDVKNGGVLTLEVGSKLLGDLAYNEAKTGRQTIIGLKAQLRECVNDENKEIAPQTIAVLKKLISAKSKVEA